MTETNTHPIAEYPEEARIAYLSLLAELCYADGEFDDDERKNLDLQLERLEVSDAGKAKVYSAIFDLRDHQRESLLETIKELNNSDLRFTLIADCYIMALADDEISPEELNHIQKIGSELGISKEQVDSIGIVQTKRWQLRNTPGRSENITKFAKECAAQLAGVGVPTAAIAVSGSVFGLGGAGITSGLAALGALVGGGMIAGTVLVVPAIAAGSIFGVKKLANLIIDSD